ncbi:MAG: hypothetical protein CMC33_01420 [Flavobacteriaceae bacterium]|nr:hypothetical protein [Flavobacteriaceae bacterium]
MIISEKHHNIVYGKTFSKLKKNQIKELVNNYSKRFRVNKIDPKKIFKNKKCLDAGCGFGRGSLFMLSNSAKFVTSVDISDNNIKTTNQNLKNYGFKNFKTLKKNISNLPFKDESFDVVWCYGVIHHTKFTDRSLKELTRVLKTGGFLKLFVYGSGGIHWYIMNKFRKIFNNFDTNQIIEILNFLNYTEIDIVNFIDNWKTSYLRTYTAKDLNMRLSSLGFLKPKPHRYGLSYDTNQRKNNFLNDKKWMGEGDLRYLIKKIKDTKSENNKLSNSEKGSNYQFENIISRNLDNKFNKIEKKLKNNIFLSVTISAKIHKKLLELLNSSKSFDARNFIKYVDQICKFLNK